jgi:hypothetical protein
MRNRSAESWHDVENGGSLSPPSKPQRGQMKSDGEAITNQ